MVNITNLTKTTAQGKVKVEADIVIKGKINRVFFEADSASSDFVFFDMSPFLAGLFLACLEARHDIKVKGSVSEKLFVTLPKISKLWRRWFPHLKPINVSVEIPATDVTTPQNVGLFFSGGVDSFYSYFDNKRSTDPRITHLIFVHGFDIGLRDTSLYELTLHNLERVAKREGVKIITVKTNLREITEKMLPWDFVHGSAMAAVAMFLRRGLNTVYFSGALPKHYLKPYGLHVELDHLWTTEGQRIIHIGDKLDRLDKIKYISNFPTIFSTLRVCWQNRQGKYNCGECEKCLRTMVGFYAAGTLDRLQTFDRPINPELLKNLYLQPSYVRYYKESLKEIKARRLKPDFLSALESCIERNANRRGFWEAVRKLRGKIGNFDSKHLNGRIYKTLYRRGIL